MTNLSDVAAEPGGHDRWPDLIATLRCASCRAINWRRGELAIIGDLEPASKARLGVFAAASSEAAGASWRCDCGEVASGLAQVAGLDALLHESLRTPVRDD